MYFTTVLPWAFVRVWAAMESDKSRPEGLVDHEKSDSRLDLYIARWHTLEDTKSHKY